MSDSVVWNISFGDLAVAVECKAPDLVDSLQFLLRDTRDLGGEIQTRFIIKRSQQSDVFEVWCKDKKRYSNANGGCIATYLAGEIIYHLIENNSSKVILHAGYVEKNGYGVLIPGMSGAGKSSLCSWLTHQGCNYLSDELVSFAPGNNAIEAFTRPFNIKTNGLSAVLNDVLGKDKMPEMLKGSISTLVSHRDLNPDYNFSQPSPKLIIFPRYSSTADYELREISSAKTALQLMQVFVNARNLSEHGFQNITNFARQIKGFELTYSHFNQLGEVGKLVDDTCRK